MPWTEVDIMDLRKQFIEAWASQRFSVSELALQYEISRKTAYKLIGRVLKEGECGLQDRSHARKTQEHRMSGEVESTLLALKAKYPSWGPKKIRKKFETQSAGRSNVPAASSIGALFGRHGLVESRPRKRAHIDTPRVLRAATAPNELWAVDFKGERPLGDGSMCYPLTLSDDYSRYLLTCHGLTSVATRGVKPLMELAFREFGLPDAIRSDCGPPFTSMGAVGGLSGLSVWWLRLGIALQRTTPGKPQQNGRHERMHRTLKKATMLPVSASAASQQARFDAFRDEYNDERPHEAIEFRCPKDLHGPALRAYPDRLPEPSYPGHFLRRCVRNNGQIKLKGNRLFLGEQLIHQEIGLEPVEDGWRVHFCTKLIAHIDEQTLTITALR